jgi:hypothetical protein
LVRATALLFDAAPFDHQVALCPIGTELSPWTNQLYRVFTQKYSAEFRDVSSPVAGNRNQKTKFRHNIARRLQQSGCVKAHACNHACPGEGGLL